MSVISLVSFHGLALIKTSTPSTSSTVWLTKAVDISVSQQLPVVLATSPGLRRPPVLLVLGRAICGGKLQMY